MLRSSPPKICVVGDILNAAARSIAPYTPQVDEEIRRSAVFYQKKLRKLSRVAYRGNVEQARAHQNWLVTNPAAKLCAFLLGGNRKKRRRTMSLAETKLSANKLNVRQDCGEPVRAQVRTTRAGKLRPNTNPGMQRRAGQLLLQHMLRAQWGDSPYETACKGRGREAAVKQINHECKNGGIKWFVDADVADCFSSVNVENLGDIIPLPASMIKNYLLISKETPIYRDKNNPLSNKTVRAGIPQGSLCSSFLWAKLLELVLDEVGARMSTSHVDDILLGAKTEEEAQAIKHALADALQKHAAGPFKLKRAEVLKLGWQMDWLGYWIRARRHPCRGAGHPHQRVALRCLRRNGGLGAALPV